MAARHRRRALTMGMQLRHSETDLVENAEINVTPFIDVILVLLVIFMIAAPVSTVNIPLNLPVSTAAPAPQPSDPVVLSVQRDLTLSVDEKTVARGQVGSVLDAATHGDKQARIFLRADKMVAYGDLMKVMDLLRDAGYLKVVLVGQENNE
jgi:TonB system transport protein ExbD (group 1)